MNSLAPQRRPPGPDDFQIAAQLCQMIVLAESVDTSTLETLCCTTLGCDTAQWLDASTARRLAQTDPFLAAAIESGVPQRDRTRAALRLNDAGETLVIGGASEINDEVFASLTAMAALMAEALEVRHDLETRRDSLHTLEARTHAQSDIIDHIHDSVIVMDLSGFITAWNKGAEHLFGYNAEEAVGQNILFLYAGEDEDEDLPFNSVLTDSGREMTVRRRKKSGELFWASITLSVIHDEDGQTTGIVGYLVDITDRLKAETELRLHARIFERSTEAIIVTEPDFRVISVNRAFIEMTGYGVDEILGKIPGVMRPASFQSEIAKEVQTALDQSGNWQGELWDWRKDDQIFPAWVSVNAVRNEKGTLTNYFIVMSDITQRKEAEAQIYRLAYYDALTGLPNRDLLFILVEQALAEAHRSRGHGALLFVDINRFKHLNDSFGHEAADVLLQEIAQRLQKDMREEDVVARVGGDEFVIALFDLSSRDDAAIVARKMLLNLRQPFQVNGLEIIVSASVGIAVFPEDGRDAETLVRAADVAQQKAKNQSTEGWLFYAQEMNLRSMERLKLETGLRRALEKQQFVLHYQPQIELASRQLVGAEALIRWQHPQQGMVSPAQFIPLAEETGLIAPMGEWVIDEACRQIAAWRQAGKSPIKIAVNLSSRQFRLDLPQAVERVLKHYDVAAGWLELELTESMLMRDAEDVIRMMEGLKGIGISLSLDDFGTGFSSLSYLKRFPIDKLKIDQSFVRGIPDDSKDMAITRSIIDLAQHLKLKVLAEGVETTAQSDFLQQAGCEQVQGFLFSRPLDVAAFDRWRDTQKTV